MRIVHRRVVHSVSRQVRQRGWSVSHDDVEEMAQTWHLEMLHNGYRRCDERPLHPFAFFILCRTVNRWLKKHSRLKSLPEAFDTADLHDTPSRTAIRNEIATNVGEAIGELSSKEQDAINDWLRKERGEAFSCKLSHGARHSRCHRTKRKLARCLREYSDLDW